MRVVVGIGRMELLRILLLLIPPMLPCSARAAAADHPFATPEIVPQTGHVGSVNHIAFSPDERWLATAGEDHRIKLWDVASGLEVRTFAGHLGSVVGVRFSPDGRWLASLGSDFTSRVWDIATGHEVQAFRGFIALRALDFSPDNKCLAVGVDSELELWRLPLGREPQGLVGHTARVRAVVFSPDGRRLASASDDHTVKLWDVATGLEVHTLSGHTERVVFVAFDPGGRFVISEGEYREVKVWDVAKGVQVQTFSLTSDAVFSQDYSWLAAAEHDYTPQRPTLRPEPISQEPRKPQRKPDHKLRLWEVATGRMVWQSTGHAIPVNPVEFSPDGRLLVTASVTEEGEYTTVKLWETATGLELKPLAVVGKDGGYPHFSPDGHYVATVSKDSTVKLWDVAAGGEWKTSASLSCEGGELRFSPKAQWLACLSDEGTVKLWRVGSNKEPRILESYMSPVYAVAFSQDGRWLASSSSREVRVWDMSAGSLLRTLHIHTHRVKALAFSSDRRQLTSGSGNELKVWDMASGQEQGTVEVDTSREEVEASTFSPDGRWFALQTTNTISVYETAAGGKRATLHTEYSGFHAPLALSPDGKWLASGGYETVTICEVGSGHKCRSHEARDDIPALAWSPDSRWLALGKGQEVALWKVTTRREMWAKEGHPHVISALAFSPDGRLLASGSRDGTIKLWEAKTGRDLSTLSGHTDKVTTLAFSADSQWLGSGSYDGTARVWNVKTREQLAALVSLREPGDWLAIKPDGLFDGTADAMRRVGWRVENCSKVLPLEAYFNDFYYPGLLAELAEGANPMARLNIAMALQLPGFRTMQAQGRVHVQRRAARIEVCFLDRRTVTEFLDGRLQLYRDCQLPPVELHEMAPDPRERNCPYRWEVPDERKQIEIVGEPSSGKAEAFKTAWDGQKSWTLGSTLHVLTVGVNQDPRNGFPKLPHAVTDAEAVDEFFGKQDMQWNKPFSRIRFWRLPSESDATRDGIRRRLSDMARHMDEEDVVLLFFAGHGKVPPGSEMFYFVPYDGRDFDAEDISDTCLSTAMLADAVRSMPARRVVIVIDACQSGGAIDSLKMVGVAKAKVEIRQAKFEKRAAAGHVHSVGVCVIAAATPLQKARQLKNPEPTNEAGGLLTQALLEAFRGKRLGGEREILIGEVVEHVKLRLREFEEQYVSPQAPLTELVGIDFPIATTVL